ncbi:MAG: hypothetical protein ACYCUD_13785 [Candidatus Dormibacteria bacterium]
MVDLEDIAVTAHQIMPEMFSLRRYRHFPSVEAARRALSDGSGKDGQPPLVLSGGGHLRMLTAAGLHRARLVDLALAGGHVHGGELAARRPVTRDLARVEGHSTFAIYQMKGARALDRADLGELLLCPTNAPASEFTKRLLQLETRATEFNRPTIVSFCRACLADLVAILGDVRCP